MKKNIEEISLEDQRKQDLEKVIRSYLISSMMGFDSNLSYHQCDDRIEQFFNRMKIMRQVREFHSLEFVCSCLSHVEEVSYLLSKKNFLVAAILFCTSGYVPGDKKSIERSLMHTKDYYPYDVSEQLEEFISAAQVATFDEKLYIDSNFLYLRDILNYPYGLEWEDFRKTWGKVLLEFNSVGKGPLVFKRFTIRKLQDLLERSEGTGIYRTPYFKLKYEAQALENIERILDKIK